MKINYTREQLESIIKKLESSLNPYEGTPNQFYFDPDQEVIMNSEKIIEVKRLGNQCSIGTRSLGGCFAIAAIVEDKERNRRCALAHYDPVGMKIELDQNKYCKFPIVMSLFNRVSQVDKNSLLKKLVIIMSPVDFSGITKKEIESIKTEAHHILGCDNIKYVIYSKYPGDFLELTIPNSSSGNPSYRTRNEFGELKEFREKLK